MRMNPLREKMVDDRLGGRTHDQRLFQFLAAAVRHDRDLGRKSFDVLRFFFQKALRNEERKISVAGAGFLDSAVELVA